MRMLRLPWSSQMGGGAVSERSGQEVIWQEVLVAPGVCLAALA